MRAKARRGALVAAIGVGCVGLRVAVTATFIWDGGGADNNWSTAANWNPDGMPDNDGTADIVFTGQVRLSPVLDMPWDMRSVTFESSSTAFVLGGSLRLLASHG